MRVSVPAHYKYLKETPLIFMAPETPADHIALQRLLDLYPEAVAGFGRNPADTTQFYHMRLKIIGNGGVDTEVIDDVEIERVLTESEKPNDD